MADEERFSGIDEKIEALEGESKVLSDLVQKLIRESMLAREAIEGMHFDLREVSTVLSQMYGLFSHVVPKDQMAQKLYEHVRQSILRFEAKYPINPPPR
ncbi:MAG: hypothetical protein ABSE62_10490 [Chthoniobacteraceae bacterium]